MLSATFFPVVVLSDFVQFFQPDQLRVQAILCCNTSLSKEKDEAGRSGALLQKAWKHPAPPKGCSLEALEYIKNTNKQLKRPGGTGCCGFYISRRWGQNASSDTILGSFFFF